MNFQEPFEVSIDSDLEEIMPMFLQNRQKDLDQLPTLFNEQKFNEIRVIAHKLAGNAGSYGLSELGEVGANMEDACLKNDIQKVEACIQDYQSYMKNLVIKYE